MSNIGAWRDVSSFSQGDTVREPWCYEQRSGGILVQVHRHIDYPGSWCVTCYELNVRSIPLESKEVCRAIEQARSVVYRAAERFMNDAKYLKRAE